jgi:hypothetical protein
VALWSSCLSVSAAAEVLTPPRLEGPYPSALRCGLAGHFLAVGHLHSRLWEEGTDLMNELPKRKKGKSSWLCLHKKWEDGQLRGVIQSWGFANVRRLSVGQFVLWAWERSCCPWKPKGWAEFLVYWVRVSAWVRFEALGHCVIL